MRKRQVTLEDGRYLIFYEFGEARSESSLSSSADEGAAAENEPRGEPEAKPVAEEERSV